MLGNDSVVKEDIDCMYFSVCALSTCLSLSLYCAPYTNWRESTLLFFLPHPKFESPVRVFMDVLL